LDEAVCIRLSLCCGRQGCRRRVLPPSLLFWGRRVYFAAVVLVATALRRQRPHEYTLARLQALFELSRPTMARWLRYFKEFFPLSDTWRRLRARLMPPVDERQLPAELIARFVASRGHPEPGLIACLAALAAD
jgi:hypothetical protein